MQTGQSAVSLLVKVRGFSSRVTGRRENGEYEGKEERVMSIMLKRRERLRTRN
jgi:hypothetical protein